MKIISNAGNPGQIEESHPCRNAACKHDASTVLWADGIRTDVCASDIAVRDNVAYVLVPTMCGTDPNENLIENTNVPDALDDATDGEVIDFAVIRFLRGGY
jgi:hypothetical protein